MTAVPGADDDKASWRAWAAQQRAGGFPDAIHAGVRAGLIEWLAGSGDGAIVTFLALGDEIDLAPLVATGRAFALTRTPSIGTDLSVHPFDSDRERHPFGFDQPVAGSPEIETSEIGVVLTPGLVFDQRGARLGRGAGYYDRFLAKSAPGTALVGIVPSRLVVSELPIEEHDVTMTHLATEHGVRPVSR